MQFTESKSYTTETEVVDPTAPSTDRSVFQMSAHARGCEHTCVCSCGDQRTTSNVVLHVVFTFFSSDSLWPNWDSPIDSSRLAGYQALVTHVAFPSIGKHHHLVFIIGSFFFSFCGCTHDICSSRRTTCKNWFFFSTM